MSTKGINACRMSNVKTCTRAHVDVESLVTAERIVFPDMTEMARVRDLDMSKHDRSGLRAN